MSLLESIIMGLIQGLTEFLPVSSSGHLALFKELFKIEEPGMFYDVLLHMGTLLAVIVVFRKDIWKMLSAFFSILGTVGRNIGIFVGNLKREEKESYYRVINNSYRKFVMLVIVSSIPTAVIGYSAKDLVGMAGELLIVPGICLMVTAILLFVADHIPEGGKLPKDVTYTNAFLVGICQGIATLPGLSRSGTTITACLLNGYSRKFAVKYSFIMSIPAIVGAMILEIKDVDLATISSSEVMNYVIGTLIAAVVGFVCIKIMLLAVKQKKFTIFAIYCMVIGAASVGMYFYTV